MPQNARRNIVVAAAVVALLVLLLLLVTRCLPRQVAAPAHGGSPTTASPATNPGPGEPPPGPPDAAVPGEVLTPATLVAPERVRAGAAIRVSWSGPGNPGDFVVIVPPDAPDDAAGNYGETDDGASIELTAPIEPGTYELRYVAGRSRAVLGRAAITVEPVGATVEAPAEVTIGSEFGVTWTGPDNEGDYITIVPRAATDEVYGSYMETRHGSPVTLTAPVEAGDAEVRYVAAQGRVVLARRAVRVIEATVSLDAPESAVAGSRIEVAWTGPGNDGDYITVVAAGTPDGRYDNYTETARGSPLELVMPIMDGAAEIRYMTGQGHRVLARRAIRVNAAVITLEAPAECPAGEEVRIEWTGPDNRGDYITIVRAGTPDGRYAAYRETRDGTPLMVEAPDEAGEAEIRYIAGQGNVVLARRAIRVTP